MSKLSELTCLDWYVLCCKVIKALTTSNIDEALTYFRSAGFDISDDIPG